MKSYWLIFTDGSYLFSKFIKKGFRHILVLAKDEFNWMIINPSTESLSWDILPHEASTSIEEILEKKKGNTIVKIKNDVIGVRNVSRSRYSNVNFLHPINCVGFVKYILGIWPFVFTPYQLYKWLIKQGFIEKEIK